MNWIFLPSKALGVLNKFSRAENYCASQVIFWRTLHSFLEKRKKLSARKVYTSHNCAKFISCGFEQKMKHGICLQTDLLKCTCKRDKYPLKDSQGTLTPNHISNSVNVTIVNCSNNVDFL